MINILIESVKQAFMSLKSNKVRSALTMLGVTIGIFSVITLVTIGEGAKTFVTSQVRSLGAGSTFFIVHPGKDDFSPPNPKFTYHDSEMMKTSVPEIKGIISITPASGNIMYGKNKFKALITGVSSNYSDLMNHKTALGRFFNEAQVEAREKKAVLGSKIAQEIFGEQSPIGEKIKIGNISYTVIGVMTPKGSVGPIDMDKRVSIPITVAQNWMGTNKVFEFLVYVNEEKDISPARDKLTSVLLKRLKPEEFHFHTQEGILNILDNILTALTGIVSGIAAIALLVGGIGIMNIMLVSVNERVREIGIRKAVGAKKIDILLQFLTESVIISLLGGLVGIVLSIIVSYAVMFYLNAFTGMPVWTILLATIVSSAVGIFFGVYPAYRASTLVPVEALRYE